MLLTDFSLFDSVLILLLALLIDAIFGEVPDRVHPVVWMGKVISFLKPKLLDPNPLDEKINGVLLALFMMGLFAVPAYFIINWTRQFLGWLPYIVVAAVLMKMTFAVKGMSKYTVPIAQAIEKGDLEKAKQMVPFIVRRNPVVLDERHTISAAVESIAENSTDGVTSPFFYFALFGVPGAIVYRVIKTLDLIVGYKDEAHLNIGWFSTKLDTIANYIPARLTAMLMVLSALILEENWRNSWKIIRRDRRNMPSINAGWTIAAMAGALSIRLENPEFYKVGDGDELGPAHIKRALRVMNLTILLFSGFVVLPILILKALVSQWLLV